MKGSRSNGRTRARKFTPGTPVSVLIVDDDADYRAVLRTIIAKDPRFEVAGEAPDGAEAITQALELQPEILLLDLSMPLMDGFQALSGIRSVSPQSRVLVCTGFENLGPDAVFLGADDYVSKRVSPSELCDRLWELTSEPKNGAGEAQNEWISPYLITAALKKATA